MTKHFAHFSNAVIGTLLCSNLVPVTQLYVSVDASTKEGLKKIDRPLFRDFWDRFIASLRTLSDKVPRFVCAFPIALERTRQVF